MVPIDCKLAQILLVMRKLKNSELIRKSNIEFKLSKKTPLIIILDNIRSLNNIGSVFRAADAFLIEKIQVNFEKLFVLLYRVNDVFAEYK